MDAGFIYGNKHRADLIPWWQELTAKVSFEELFDQNHLCKLRGLVANYKKPDLSNVGKVGNEYNLGELSTAMCKYVDTVQDVIEEHLQDHEHILVFGCTIEHCEELKEVIPNSETLHSKSKDPQAILEDFAEKKFRVLISVNKLSIGFDFPPASALVLARPTMSSALYLQIVGRILRNSPGKEVAVLVDLTENTAKHCPTLDLDRIAVNIPPLPGGGVAPIKFCEALDASGDMCYAENHPSVVFCVECGKEFPAKSIPEEYKPDLSAVAFTAVEPEWYPVEGMEVSEHTSAKNEKRLLRVVFTVGSGYGSKTTSTWICTASDYSGGAVTMGRKTWEIFTDDDFPDDLDMALWVAQESFRQPTRVKCSITQEGYLNILDYDFSVLEEVVSDSFEEVPIIGKYNPDDIPF
jgi:DNA repair protein RadD